MAKIILVGSAYPFRGGLAAFNERLILELNRQGHNASIITFTLQYPKILFPGKTQFSSSPPKNYFPILRMLNSVNPFNWIRVGKFIKKEKPDVLLFKFWLPFMGPAFGTAASIVKKNKHTKIISILDNVIPHEKRIGDKLFTRYFLSKVDGAVAMSQSVKDDFQKLFTNKTCIVNPHPLFDNFGSPIPKSQAILALKLDPQYKYILFFGIIREYKGLKLLLNAFSKIDYQILKLKLIVAGEFYQDSKPYFDLISDLKLTEHIILFNHFIPDEEVVNYFCAADLIAQPYLHATQSGVTQIAFQMNKPCLVTNVGGLAELITNNKSGYITDLDENSIASAIEKYFTENMEQTFVEQIILEKKKFEWSSMTSNILSLINK